MSDESNPEPKGYTVKKRGAIGTARADFMCNSATCRTKKGARVYELPAATSRCPVCGSKKITKLMSSFSVGRGLKPDTFNPKSTSTSKSTRTDLMMQGNYERLQRAKDDAKDARRNSPMLGVSLNGGLAGAVQEGMTKAGYANMPVPVPVAKMGVAKPTLGVTDATLGGVKSAGAVRVPVDPTTSKRWRPSPAEVAEARRQA